MDLIGLHRKQHLARAAKLAEAREDESDHFLEAQVGIKTKSPFAKPKGATVSEPEEAASPPGEIIPEWWATSSGISTPSWQGFD